MVSADEREAGARALLNLGHTFGHAIEAGVGYGEWLHGEAVAAGTMLAAEVSRRLGLLDERDVERMRRLYQRAGLPVTAPDLGAERYLELMEVDKKVEAGRIRFVLLQAIGEAFVTADVPDGLLEDVLSGRTPRWLISRPTPCTPSERAAACMRKRRPSRGANSSAIAIASSIRRRSVASSTRRRCSSITKAIFSARASRTVWKSRRSDARSRARSP